MPVRILIADEHPVLRAGLRGVLCANADFLVVGEAADAESCLRLMDDSLPDVVLVNSSLPGFGCQNAGMQTTSRLSRRWPGVHILVLSMGEDQGWASAMRMGASGTIPLLVSVTELANAVRAVARGELYIHSPAQRVMPEPDSGEQVA